MINPCMQANAMNKSGTWSCQQPFFIAWSWWTKFFADPLKGENKKIYKLQKICDAQKLCWSLPNNFTLIWTLNVMVADRVEARRKTSSVLLQQMWSSAGMLLGQSFKKLLIWEHGAVCCPLRIWGMGVQCVIVIFSPPGPTISKWLTGSPLGK